jgi:hypothetical protein
MRTAKRAGRLVLPLLGVLVLVGAASAVYAQPGTSTPKSKTFTISGSLSGQLAPGAPDRPLNLVLSNPNNQSLALTNVTVTVHHTSAGASCDAANFAVTQYRGPYPVTITANRTASLSQLGLPSSAWPQIRMLDLPKNQDTCKNVTLALAYSGTGQGA